ncbi:hypothetical protein ABIB73_007544 [Bradyrhizobium sp. F1.4.3]
MIEHLAKVRCPSHNVDVGLKRIDTEIVTNAQLDPGRGHDLHEPDRSPRRYGLRIPAAFGLHDGTNPTLRHREPMRGFGHERGVCKARKQV